MFLLHLSYSKHCVGGSFSWPYSKLLTINHYWPSVLNNNTYYLLSNTCSFNFCECYNFIGWDFSSSWPLIRNRLGQIFSSMLHDSVTASHSVRSVYSMILSVYFFRVFLSVICRRLIPAAMSSPVDHLAYDWYARKATTFCIEVFTVIIVSFLFTLCGIVYSSLFNWQSKITVRLAELFSLEQCLCKTFACKIQHCILFTTKSNCMYEIEKLKNYWGTALY